MADFSKYGTPAKNKVSSIPTSTQPQASKFSKYGTAIEPSPGTQDEKKPFLIKAAEFLAPSITGTIKKAAQGEKIGARDIIGSALEVGSYALPLGAVAKGVGLGAKALGFAPKIASKFAVPVAQKAATTIGKRTLQTAGEGALSGGLFGASQSVTEGGGAADIAKSAATGAALGGAFGAALPVAGRAIKFGTGKVAAGAKMVAQATGLKKVAQEEGRKMIEDEFRQTANKYVSASKALRSMEMKAKTEPLKILSSYGDDVVKLLDESSENGKINPNNAQEFLREKIAEMGSLKTEVVKTKVERPLLKDFYSEIRNVTNRESWSNLKKSQARVQAEKIMNQLREAYPEGNIPLDEIDRIKTEQTALSKSYNNTGLKPFEYDAHAIIGKAARNIVKNVAKDTPTDELNMIMQSHYDAIDLLEKLRGKTPHGGRLTKLMGRLGGEVAGAVAGGSAGHPILGWIGGRIIADQVFNILGNNLISNPLKRSLLKGLSNQDPQAIQAALKYLDEIAGETAKRKLLPPPSFIPLGGRRPPETPPQLLPAQPGPTGFDPKSGRFKKTYQSLPAQNNTSSMTVPTNITPKISISPSITDASHKTTPKAFRPKGSGTAAIPETAALNKLGKAMMEGSSGSAISSEILDQIAKGTNKKINFGKSIKYWDLGQSEGSGIMKNLGQSKIRSILESATKKHKELASPKEFTLYRMVGENKTSGVQYWSEDEWIAKGFEGKIQKIKIKENDSRVMMNWRSNPELLDKNSTEWLIHSTPIKKSTLGNPKPPAQAFGAFAGLEPEKDEQGRITGVGFDPTKAGIGLALTAGLSRGKGIPDMAKAFKGFNDLTTKVLERLKGKSITSKQEILDLANMGELKQAERDLIRSIVKDMPDNVPVQQFANKVKTELLPLKRHQQNMRGTEFEMTGGGGGRYENITLPSELRGPIANYSEHVYESPIKTSAGSIHFDVEPRRGAGQSAPNYFAHTRIEDLAVSEADRANRQFGQNHNIAQRENVRRVIELQSDLFQKGGLEQEGTTAIKNGYPIYESARPLNEQKIAELKARGHSEAEIQKYLDHEKEAKLLLNSRKVEIAKLEPYRNTWHERVIREEVKQAAMDGKTKLQFPTGETAMKIEGLGELGQYGVRNGIWTTTDGGFTLKDSPFIRVGESVKRMGSDESWIITDVLGDGKFKAAQKELVSNDIGEVQQHLIDKARQNNHTETFDISGKVDTNNPIYKFYEKEVQKYLRNKYGGTVITDPQGVTWVEIPIKKEMAKMPIEAFGAFPLGYAFGKKKEEEN